VPADNEIYDRPGDIWWDEHQPLSAIRTALNPARLEYFARVFAALGIDPAGKVTVDVGCGGGLLAEEAARLGARVIGVDPSLSSLAIARAHAEASGLSIDYRAGAGEHLPVDDASADIVYCVDVLEHVQDLDAVVSETARVLKPGGLYLYDTINRTRLSKLVVIKLAQEWAVTACVPANIAGMAPRAAPPVLWRAVRQLRQGKISYAEFGRQASFELTRNTWISYIGHAICLDRIVT
jgi:2-polyprenyl-6-hydroxyphenyl methylase / 3-demethylubiquinone-9 3-methyltransferase